MPKKPRTNKRPPPKQLRPMVTQSQSLSLSLSQPQPHPQPHPPSQSQPQAPTNLPYLNPNAPIDLSSLVPPPSTIDPNDPNFPSALSDWSASALGKLNQIPKLSQSQLSAIAGAAAGVRPALPLSLPLGLDQAGNANPNSNSNLSSNPPNLPIDLPASLAALFEAKLTLDREKAKLMQMQRELKSHRDSLLAANKLDKGKNVIKDVEEQECTCGRHVHDYPASAHSGEGSEEYYYETDEDCLDDCDCDCHHYYHDHDHDHDHDACDCPDSGEYEECDHDHDHDHGDHDEHDHHHHHHHHHEQDHAHGHNHHHDHHQAHPHDHGHAHADAHDTASVVHNANDIAAQVRQATAELKTATAQANRAAASQMRQVADVGPPRKNLQEDPERLDELVRELFNWIKAVVWTIEQAALVAGRRNWAPTQ